MKKFKIGRYRISITKIKKAKKQQKEPNWQTAAFHIRGTTTYIESRFPTRHIYNCTLFPEKPRIDMTND